MGLVIGFGGIGGLLAIDPEAKRNGLDTIPLQRLAMAAYIVFSVLLAAPLILVGRGILQWKPWAHTGAILTGAVSLLLFPIGTFIGIYTLYIMLLPETEPLFLSPPESR